MATAAVRWQKLLQQMDESLLHMDDTQKEKFFYALQNAVYDMLGRVDSDSSEYMLLWEMAEDTRYLADNLEHKVHGCMSWRTCGWSGDELDFEYELCKECKKEVLKLRIEQ